MPLLIVIASVAASALSPAWTWTMLVAFFVVLPWATFNLFERHWYTHLIPERIGIGPTLAISSDTHLFSGCGVAAFWLTNETVEAVAREGVGFFADARTPRSDGRRGYPAWQATPMPDKTFSNGWWYGFRCAYLGFGWKRAIYDAARRPGSFYSSDPGNSDLLVLPDLRLVVLIYQD